MDKPSIKGRSKKHKLQKYFVRADVDIVSTYLSDRKKTQYNDTISILHSYMAESPEDATQQYISEVAVGLTKVESPIRYSVKKSMI